MLNIILGGIPVHTEMSVIGTCSMSDHESPFVHE